MTSSAKQEKSSSDGTWDAIALRALKANDVKLIAHVPDRMLATLIKKLHADPFFTCFPTTREEEAVGIVCGARMGGYQVRAQARTPLRSVNEWLREWLKFARNSEHICYALPR